MNVSPAELDEIRQTSLPDLMGEDGIVLKKVSDTSFKALCPFHEDKIPSLSVNLKGRTWLWRCFGCGAGGDLVKYVMMRNDFTFTQAVDKLLRKRNGNQAAQAISDTKGASGRGAASSLSDTKVLTEVVRYYHETLKEHPGAQEYLKKRGLFDPALIKEYKLGYSNGTLPRDPDLLDSFKRLGILNDRASEHFFGCVTFPIEDRAGNIVSLYGRNISTPQHLYLKGPHKSVFNGRCVKGRAGLFITESIIDALSLIKLGIRDAVSLYGTNGLTEEHEKLLEESDLREVYLCLDNDEAGKKASERLESKIPEQLQLFHVLLPEGVKDPNDFLLSGRTKEDFLALASPVYRNGLLLSAKDFQIEEKENEILFKLDARTYRVRGLSTERLDQLKVSLKVSCGEGSHLDTLDLYQARSRTLFSRMTEKLIGANPAQIERDLKQMIDSLETIQAKKLEEKGSQKKTPFLMTEAERKEALQFLKDPHLIPRIVSDAKLAGHVGEEDNFLLAYLVSISRKLKEPLGLLIISQSAAGKTALQDRVLFFTPLEDQVKLTRLTDQSLFYQEENALVHKLLAIEEEEGAQGASYSIRHLLSANGLVNLATMKDEVTGKLTSVNRRVKGPTAVMITTTNSEINFETYNRFIIITVDESQRQTIAILKVQRARETLEGMIHTRNMEHLQRLHYNAQRLLRPLEVVNPFAESLTFTDSILRARREQVKYLNLIKAVSFLRQYQKEVKTASDGKAPFQYIEVDKQDIDLANRLAEEFLVKGLDEMSPQARRLVPLLAELRVKRAQALGKDSLEITLTQREVREFTRWSNYQLRKQVRELVELEYLIPVSGGRGKQFAYLLAWDGEAPEKALHLQSASKL